MSTIGRGPTGFDITKFVQDLEHSVAAEKSGSASKIANAEIQVGGKSFDLKGITQALVQNNFSQFGGMFTAMAHRAGLKRKVERIYSRREIRELVKENLIPEYQLDSIIDAVSDILYKWHVSA